MIFNRFQGDPAIKITESGAIMKFIGGQPVMDQGLENAIIISLFTKKGWWGNTLFIDENKKIGSDYEQVRITIDVRTINETRDEADIATKWMKDVKLASKIDITVTNPFANRIKTQLIIYSPGKDIQELLFFQNGINWLSQAKNPAHERF